MITISSNIDKVIQHLGSYSKSLPDKIALLVDALADCGIVTAEISVASGTHQMPNLIRFEKEIKLDKKHTIGVVVGIGETFPSVWIDAYGDTHSDTVKPLSMMEFGSAAFALPQQEAFGGYGGQGTFSVSGNEDKAVWYVTKIDEDGNERRVLATAIAPTQPMYKAMQEMRNQIVFHAKRIFGE